MDLNLRICGRLVQGDQQWRTPSEWNVTDIILNNTSKKGNQVSCEICERDKNLFSLAQSGGLYPPQWGRYNRYPESLLKVAI